MKKLVLGVAGVGGLGILAVLAMALSKPDTIHLERSITVSASTADVASFAQDLKRLNEWSPWMDKDPDMQMTYGDSTIGIGAWYSWEGNDDVGKGKMTVTADERGKVMHKLEFFAPWETVAQVTVAWAEKGAQTEVTWSYDADADFNTKLMTVFMDFDAMLGPDYEKGLQNLKPLVEAAAKDRVVAEAAAELAETEAAAAAQAAAE
jgi:hypothetical protein